MVRRSLARRLLPSFRSWLSTLTNLHALAVDWTKLKREDLPYFRPLTRLERLSINGSQVAIRRDEIETMHHRELPDSTWSLGSLVISEPYLQWNVK
jgi:hypothetical protein